MREKRWILFTSLFVLIDQFIKLLIRGQLTYLEEISVVPSLFSLTYVKNQGGAWSLFSSFPWLLLFFSSLIVVILLWFLLQKKLSFSYQLSYSFLLGGAIGNLIDRLFLGAVTDYLSFTIFGYHFPIFNFADICVVLGTFLLLILEIRREQNGISSKNDHAF